MQEMQETQVWSLGREDPLEKEMATHISIFAWEIPWTEEPGGLHSPLGLKRVGHDLATNQQQSFVLLSFFVFGMFINNILAQAHKILILLVMKRDLFK